MQADLWRASALLTLALLIGLASGKLLACLIVATTAYGAWSHWRLRQLLGWLRDRNQHAAPDVPGVFEAICSGIDFLRNRHRRRKRKLAAPLKQFEDATSALPDATVILGPGGEIRWANTAARNQLGIRWPDDRRQRLTNLLRHPDVATLLESQAAAETTVDIPSPIDPGVQLSLRVVPYAHRAALDRGHLSATM
ncbi:MAG: Phosphate regulon sensor protein PhoR [Gammaproteobacteria bacterium]|nr:Phosphate regulon sensor protein PhoR [Gammaproteobacteria bacterium]